MGVVSCVQYIGVGHDGVKAGEKEERAMVISGPH